MSEHISLLADLDKGKNCSVEAAAAIRSLEERISALEKVAEEQKWRHLGDLPFHEHGRILVLYNWGYTEIKMADTARRDMDVTHWMPLPDGAAGYLREVGDNEIL